jgi:hypothetical protein
MATLPDPPQAVAEVWDKATFNDLECPGLASVSISRANKWDTKKAQGSHGGERQFKGADLATVKIKVRLWTADDYVDFNENILPLLEPDPGKQKPSGVSLGHAVAWARNLRAITVDSVSGPESDNAGFVEYDIDATEYREPDKTNATGKASGGSSLCETIRAQLELRYADLAVQKNLYTVYLSPATFDAERAETTRLKILEIETAIAGLENNLTVGGCREGVPFPATDYEAAEEIRDAA